MRLVLLIMLLSVGSLAAQTVRLVSQNGVVTLEGALLGFDGEYYRIDTIYGPLTVDSSTVICKGLDCPGEGGYLPTIRISGHRLTAEVAMPKLIEAYARAHEATISQETTEPGHAAFILRKEGQLWARFEIHATNTREAYADLVSEVADIALVATGPTPEEAEMAQTAGSGDLLTGRRALVIGFEQSSSDGIEPVFDRRCGLPYRETAFDIQAGESQSAAAISLYTPARRLPAVGRSFLRFAKSDAVQELVLFSGLLPPSIRQRPFNELGDRLAHAVSQIGTDYRLEDIQRITTSLVGHRRLSPTFRFLDGRNVLDMQSRDMIGRLSDALVDPSFNGSVVTLAGFSSDDPDGFAQSARDAQRVLRELEARADYPNLEFVTQPFGNVLPVICDASDRAERLNRRVEIWVK